ncbi:Ig-like domain-containing protein [Niallia taxi]|uniref:Ig-like domain-containing protein n=1 Tax=Niallia taxi TaxID=2499688 RepID=UPI00203C0A69|nr:Ig-like domain-containing protein [Niallia taxi]MCM3216766.1 Ig-like domain-containing protein [Niallia taxi]
MKKITALITVFIFLLTINHANAIALSESEPNDSPNEATELQLNQSSLNQYKANINGEISSVFDYDYYKINLSQAGSISVKISENAGTRFEVSLVNEANDVINLYTTPYEDTDAPVTVFSEGLDKGNYYIVVEYYTGNNSEHIPYSLEVEYTKDEFYEKEENDDISQANAIQLNNVYKGYTDKRLGGDYYSVKVPKNGEFKVDVSQNPSARFVVKLYDNKGKIIEESKTIYNDNTEISNLIYTGLPAGNYYIKINGDTADVSNVPYQFKSSFKENNAFEIENNDTMANSNLVSIKKMYSGTFKTKGDKDYYRFILTKKMKLYMDVNMSSDKRYSVSVFDQNNNHYVNMTTSTEIGKFKSIANFTLEPGTYFMSISGTDAKPVPYQFLINEKDSTPPDKPKVNSMNSISDQTTSITGITEPNARVYVYDDDNNTKWVKADKKGNFKIAISKLKAGTNLYVRAVDTSGNESKSTVIIVKDKTAPPAPKVDKITPKTTKVTGKAETGVNLVVKSGNKSIGKGTTDSKGNFKVKIPRQKDKTKLLVYAVDTSNNTSKATTIYVK